ncbi:MAG: glycosyltransferase family 39 protein [Anaerolineae bacterium]
MLTLASLVGILLLAFALRAYKLGDQNIWWDEGLAVWAARKPFIAMTLWTAGDVHPPLYFWSLWPWVRLVGESEFAVRYLSLIFGLLTVALIYPLGKRLINRRVALLATLLLAVSRFHVWWSQEMRMYVLAGLLGTLSVYWMVRLVSGESSKETSRQVDQETSRQVDKGKGLVYLFTYLLVTILALYTLYLSAVILVIENLFALAVLFWRKGRDRRVLLIRWALAQAGVLALFAPWLLLATSRMRTWSVAAPVKLRFVYQLYGTLLSLGISTYLERYIPPVVGFGLICLAGLGALGWQLRHRREPVAAWQAGLLLTLFLMLPPLIIWLLTQPRALFYTPRVEARYLLPFAPPFYLLLAWSVMLLGRRSRLLGGLALIYVLGAFAWTLPTHYAGRYLRDELQTMTRVIWAYGRPDDAVLLVSGNRYPVFLYYYDRAPAPGQRPPVYRLPRQAMEFTPENVDRELKEIAAQHPRLWLAWVNGPMQDPQGLVERWLNERYARPLSLGFAHNALHLYTLDRAEPTVPPENLAPQHPLAANLGGLQLLGYDLPTVEFRPGDTIRLGLYWRPAVEREVAVALVDKKGRVLEERTLALSPAGDGIVRQQLEFPVFSHTPAGPYHFELRPGQIASEGLPLGRLIIAATEPLPPVQTIPHSMQARLGDEILFLGYDLGPTTARPGDVLALDLYWQATRKVSQRYTVFTHLLGQAHNPATGGPMWAQHDSEPLDGGYPTSQWFVGQTIRDHHELRIDPAAPPGEYQLEVGLYLLATGERLPVLGQGGEVVGDRILLDTIQVMGP